MQTRLTTVLFFLGLISFAQKQEFNIIWEGSKDLETEYEKFKIPNSSNFFSSYTHQDGFFLYQEWDTNSPNLSSAQIINPRFEAISATELYGLNKQKIKSEVDLEYSITSSRDKKKAFFKLNPIIKENGVFKRLVAFELSYNSSSRSGFNNQRSLRQTTNSVLRSGNWYKFYVEQSGVYRLDGNFLSDLGIDVSSLDPRTLKIYGNGGLMIPQSNSVDYPLDPIENAIMVVGEEDGSLDNGDYILFYAEGPHGRHQHDYNQQFNTNLNLFADRTYYYINVDSGFGKRVQSLNQPDNTADFEINSFQDYQFYEVDEENLVRIGRRWFGEDFDLENERSFDFNFPNLVSSNPVKFEIAIGSVAPIPTSTSMGIGINGTSFDLNLVSVDFSGSILGAASVFNQELDISSENISVGLNYNNGGNPSANAYLDYINIEATRRLQYVGDQLRFRNEIVATTPGVVQYNVSNSSQVSYVWDITDKFNVGGYSNNENAADFIFKAFSGELREYIAFSNSDALTPSRDNNTRLITQDLKGTVFQDNSGQF
ncbi:MAG: peptidase C25, partial [Bacteroidota bacterium]